MTLRKLARGWPHDPAKLRHASLAGGPIMLQKGWPHDPAKIAVRWPHEAANRQARLPVHASRCQRGRASLGLGASCRLLQPDNNARAHPTSVRSSHASGAFAPLLAGTNRCRLRWPCDALPHRGPASHVLHAPACARRVPLAWTGQTRAEAPERRRVARSRTMSRVPSSLAPRAPGSPARFVAGPGEPRAHRSGRDPPRMPPRERRHRRKDQGAFCRDGTLTRAEDDSSVRAWTAAPSRRLRERHCSGARAPLLPPSQRLLLTRKALEPARPAGPGEPKPSATRRVAAPVTASTTESARGQMCRELHGPLFPMNRIARNRKSRNNDFFYPLVAHRIVHSLSPSGAAFPPYFARAMAPAMACLGGFALE